MTIPVNDLLAMSVVPLKANDGASVKDALNGQKALALISKKENALHGFIQNKGASLFFLVVHVDDSKPYGFSLKLEQATAYSDDVVNQIILNDIAGDYRIYAVDESVLADVKREVCIDPNKHTVAPLTNNMQFMIACQFLNDDNEKAVLIFDNK